MFALTLIACSSKTQVALHVLFGDLLTNQRFVLMKLISRDIVKWLAF